MHRKIVIAALAAMTVAGCQSLRKAGVNPAYETLPQHPGRNTDLARRLNGRAVKLIEAGKLDEAEKKLKAALEADLFFGPAHNNLGIIYFKQKKFYLAAWEYQYAIKLMPRKAEPQNNLGMVFETVGRLKNACESYEKALTLEPGAVEIAANLARAYVRAGRKDDKTRRLLEEIVMKDTRSRWIAWAREHLALMPKSQQPTTRPADGG